MENAIENLDRAARRCTDLEKAKALVRLAAEDVRRVVIYADGQSRGAPAPASVKPDFTPPPPPKDRPRLNMMLHMGIGKLSAAYDALAAATSAARTPRRTNTSRRPCKS